MGDITYRIENNLNPAPYIIEVAHDVETDQHIITLTMLGKKYSRIEKTRVRAVIYAKEMNESLEAAFRFTWEDNS